MVVDTSRKIKKSDWLIMVYLAGDNNLSPHSIAFLQELENAACTTPVEDCKKRARVVAAFDSPTPWPKGARYLEIKRHEDPLENPYHKKMKWPLHNNLVDKGHIVVSPDFCNDDGGETDRRRPVYPEEPTAEEALYRFFLWVKENYEAKKYMLILFGHGTLVAGNTFLADTSPPSYLKLGEFANVLGKFTKKIKKKIAVLACDNCVMNGIESAVQLCGQVEYMLGSQDLMLANAWPVRTIIEEVRKALKVNPEASSKDIAMTVLRASVVNMLDFTLMERSAEQAICNVSEFTQKGEIVKTVKALSGSLQAGLRINKDEKPPVLFYPVVADIVRLARLEAQSYWSETFVDLYDFAALLVKRCDEYLRMLKGPANLIKVIEDIRKFSFKITEIFREKQIVPRAYYVGPKLQYSHGISIFFPWTLPEGPITFEPVPPPRPTLNPKKYKLKTPFEEYRTYLFAQREYGDWARFIVAFLKATLRDVRRAEFTLEHDPATNEKLVEAERPTFVIDLQKSGSSTGDEDEGSLVKNYPRRFYLSPADCTRRSKIFNLFDEKAVPNEGNVTERPGKVLYLGWNLRGLVAEVVEVPDPLPGPASSPSTDEAKNQRGEIATG